jgi:uncharacterized membrane protein YccF (DUF307 family)
MNVEPRGQNRWKQFKVSLLPVKVSSILAANFKTQTSITDSGRVNVSSDTVLLFLFNFSLSLPHIFRGKRRFIH